MIIYVLDNNIFSRSLNNLSFDIFPDIWEPWNELIQTGRGQWLKKNHAIFQKPTNAEGKIIAKIYQSTKFREGVKEKSIRNGSPEADAMIIAKAKCIGGIVVTAESDDKPNSEKIPNICISQNIPYMTLDEFYRTLKNIYNHRPESIGVTIQYELGNAVPLIEDEVIHWIYGNSSL